MKNLSKQRFIVGALITILTVGTVPLTSFAQSAPSASCTQFQLTWDVPPTNAPSTDVAGGKVSATFYSGENPVSTTTVPAVPTDLPSGSSASWKCSSSDAVLGSAETQQEQDLGQGMVLCAKAAQLAAKFGGFTAINTDFTAKIQTSVLNKTKDYISQQFKSATNVQLDFNKIGQQAQDFAKKNLGVDVSSLDPSKLFDSSQLTTAVNSQIDKITSSAKDLLSSITKNAASQAASTIGIPGIGGDTVPVKAQGVEDKLDDMRRMQEQQIAEQKKAELLADTRAKCAELLKTTNETIKHALLYQLSTQITDWIINGKTPQFIEQPGKFLEDTGRLALDRFISRVAPQLCQPFRLAVQLQIPSVRREDNPFYEQISCTLDKVVANVDNFYQDFRQGGWIAYDEMLKPQNNYYGALLMTMDEANRQRVAAQDAAQQGQTNGYSPVKQCTEWAKFEPYTGPINSGLDIRDDGNGNYFLRNPNASPEVTGGTGPIDNTSGNAVSYLTQDPQTGPIVAGVRFWANPPIAGTYFWECEADKISQPANIAANEAVRASQVDLDNLAASQDVSAFLQTIEDSIINKLTKAGVKGLQGLLKGLPIPTP